MARNQKGFGLIEALAAVFVIFIVGIISFVVLSSMVHSRQTKNEMFAELNKLQLPASFVQTSKDYHAAGFENKAELKATYKVSGTREEVFQAVVKSLGLDPNDHKDSSDQELQGVGSPIYKSLFWLSILPDISTDFYGPCAQTATDQELHSCLNKTPGHGKNAPATSAEITLQQR